MSRDELVEHALQYAKEHYPQGWLCGAIEFEVSADKYETLLIYPCSASQTAPDATLPPPAPAAA